MVSTTFSIVEHGEKKKPATIFVTTETLPPNSGANAFHFRAGKRHWLILLGFIGIFNIYTVRTCLSMAMVAMVRARPPSNSSSAVDICPVPDGLAAVGNGQSTGQSDSPKYDWDTETQGIIQGAYFYGYIATQVAGGWLAKHIGGKYPFGLGILISGILTLLSPIAANYHYGAFITVRILEGLSTGVCYPALQQLLVKWTPACERSRLSTMVNAGAPVGNVVVLAVSGIIGDFWGWEAIFYTVGGVTCFWYIFWQFFVYNSPEEHPFITEDEMIFVTGEKKSTSATGEKKPKETQPPIPWRSILTSGAVWAMVFAHFGQNWGNYTLMTNLPNYMKNILKFELSANGVFSALPYLSLWIMSIIAGYISDYICHEKIMSRTNSRKLFNTIGNIVPIAAIIAVGYVGCDWAAAVALLTLANGFSGLTAASYPVTSLDIAPAFAAIIFGLSNTISNVPGIISPYTVGLITAGPDGQTLFNWRIIFFLSSGIRVVTTVVYAVLASGEVAPWNSVPKKTTAA